MGGDIPKMRSLGRGNNAPTLGLYPTCKTCQGNRIPIVKVKGKMGKSNMLSTCNGKFGGGFCVLGKSWSWEGCGLKHVVWQTTSQPALLPQHFSNNWHDLNVPICKGFCRSQRKIILFKVLLSTTYLCIHTEEALLLAQVFMMMEWDKSSPEVERE